MRRLIATALGLATLGLFGCGGDESTSGTASLKFYVFPEPSGSFAKAAKECSEQSQGRYSVEIATLPSAADDQRTQLVRRLAAEDSDIDIIGMDVIWTAEFAEAGWLREWTGRVKEEVTRGTLEAPIQTATYQGKLYAAPANSNTQLLWYRKDLVKSPPETWDEMIDQAVRLRKYIEVQGRQYEGLTVWFNSLVSSAGGQILSGPREVALGPEAERAAAIMRRLATSPAADPSLSNQQEDQNRLAFEQGVAAFELNYPFVWPSAQANAPQIFKNMGYAPWPSVEKGKPARVSIGGANYGVSSYSEHPEEAFEAAACMRGPEHQKTAAIKGGLPPTLGELYDDPALAKPYPFHELIKQQLENASVRPQTPAYSDVSLAISKALSPPKDIDPDAVVDKLKTQVDKSLGSEALL